MKYIDRFQGGEVSFWEVFPYMKNVSVFRKLYKEDRSKDKNKSSKVMWYLSLSKDIDSEFYSMDDEDRHGQLVDILELDVNEYLGGSDELDMLMNAFEDFIDTVIIADIRALEKKLIERKRFIQRTQYTLDEIIYPVGDENFKPYLKKGTASQLDKMLVDTKNIHEEIRKLRAAAMEEQAEHGKAGRESSFLES